MNSNGAIPTHRPLHGVALDAVTRERPCAPRHEFLVANFFARTAVAAASLAPRHVNLRAHSVRRKLLNGDFP